MRHGFTALRESAPVSVIGAGIMGCWQALSLAKTGCSVTLYARDESRPSDAASHWAAGMLAPFCESENTEPVIARLGVRSLALWREALPDTRFHGSLVVAHARDRSDYERFAERTAGHERVRGERLASLERALEGRFAEALFFPGEGHVEPRTVIPQLRRLLAARGVSICTVRGSAAPAPAGIVLDCRGLAARDTHADLRGVKGEMVVVETDEIALSRPVRLIHPRWPLYIVPRAGNRFMIGATSIESEDSGVSVRSVLELLSAAYAVHPAFAEARVVEFGAGLRPAFPDNRPRIRIAGDRISINGLYRHGFLLAPALAELAVAYVTRGAVDPEVMQCS
jgi:glycine oxidase